MGSLVDAFRAELPEAAGASRGEDDPLERALEAFVAAGRAAWPDLRVEPEALVRFVAGRIGSADDLPALPAADLALACACAGGDPQAIQTFERRYFADIDIAAARMGASDAVADEVKQVLRVRFFVGGADRPPAIAEYAGRGDLHGWVRVSAAREVLRLYRTERRALALEQVLLDEIGADPESAALKRRCRADFVDAFRATVAALPARERMLLKLQVVDGLGCTAIGAIHRVHRATAARWLAETRERIIHETQRRLAAQLHLTSDEVTSLIRVARSQLDMSLISLLEQP